MTWELGVTIGVAVFGLLGALVHTIFRIVMRDRDELKADMEKIAERQHKTANIVIGHGELLARLEERVSPPSPRGPRRTPTSSQ